MPKQKNSFLRVDPLQQNWDASLQALVSSCKGSLRIFDMKIIVQGSHATPSRVRIQLQNSVGEDLAEQFYVRCKILPNPTTTGAVITSVDVGTVVETLTASLDLVVQSNAQGKIEVTLIDAVVESFLFCLGPAPVCPIFGNPNGYLQVTHA